MCGIVGQFFFDRSREVAAADVKRMCDTDRASRAG